MGISQHLHVIATTEEGTRAALVEAEHVARRLNVDRLVLLVLRIGELRAAADGSADERAIVDDYRMMAGLVGIRVIVRLCVCSGYREATRRIVPRRSVVVVGGRRRWWWPTREQRIADQLKSTGHETVFAEASSQRHDTG